MASFLIIFLLYTCMLLYIFLIYQYNVISLLLLCLFSGLTIWYQTDNWCTLPWGRLLLSFSEFLSCLEVFLHRAEPPWAEQLSAWHCNKNYLKHIHDSVIFCLLVSDWGWITRDNWQPRKYLQLKYCIVLMEPKGEDLLTPSCFVPGWVCRFTVEEGCIRS